MGRGFWHTLAMTDQREQAGETAAPRRPVADDRESRARERIRPREIGGPEGPEPTRYGDWERKGRCIDF